MSQSPVSDPPPIAFVPIGVVRSPYVDLFGTPRQAGLVDAPASIEVTSTWRAGLQGLDGFSHVWIIWVFDRNKAPGRARVRPPRLGGAQKIGVFATRSPYRPNPIGLSVARIDRVTKTELWVRGLDVADGTPVLDIKPYLPYADAHPQASAGWAEGALPDVPVRFDASTAQMLEARPELRTVIAQCFGLDPRPARHRQQGRGRVYAVRLWDVDVRAEIDASGWRVFEIEGSRL